MAVNDLIAQGVRPMQIESPLNMMAKMQALREAEQQNQMFQQKQQDYLREQQLQNALRGRLSGGGVNIDNAHELLQYGAPGRQVYDALHKGNKEQADVKNINSQITSRTSEDDKRKVETLDKHLEIFRAIVPPKQAAASPEGVTALVHSMYAHPVLGPMAAQTGTEEQAVQRNLTLWNKDPVAWEASMSGLNGQGLLDTMKGTRQNNNTGGAIVGQTVDFAGRVVPGSQVSTPTTVSPDAKLRSQDAAAARAQSAAQHADAQSKPTLSSVIDPGDPSRELRIDANVYKQGTSIGAPGVYGHTIKEPVPGVTLPAKEIQKREAMLPKATQAVKTFETTTDTLISDLEKLKAHKGLDSITGIAAGRLPGITSEGRAAEALLAKILAKGGFSELSSMRAASPTGGALGNVSDTEGKYLRSAFAALDRTQDSKDVRKNIDEALKALRTAKANTREAFDMTYEYRSGQPAKPAAATPTTPPPPPGFKPD